MLSSKRAGSWLYSGIFKCIINTLLTGVFYVTTQNFQWRSKDSNFVQIINEGMQVMHEIDTLQGGLNDTIKAVAEELEVKPAILKKASQTGTQSRVLVKRNKTTKH
jgi:hypothetical protein